MEKVVIFGGGVAGLAAAHELAERGFEVHVYEKDAALGGMARSMRYADTGLPTEHSWRAFMSFYHNFFELAARIPLLHDGNDNGDVKSATVMDTLSDPVDFVTFNDSFDDQSKRELTLHPKSTWRDKIVMGYHVIKCMMSNRRREAEYADTAFLDLVAHRVSKGAHDEYLAYLGPGIGLDAGSASLHHVTRMVEAAMDRRHLPHKGADVEHWHVMTKPTSEAWFEPWERHLRALGVRFHLGHELVAVRVDGGGGGDKIIACTVLDRGSGATADVEGDAFVMAINPYFLNEIVGGVVPSAAERARLAGLVQHAPHRQISFRLLLSRRVVFPPNTAFVFADSEFNITVCPQEQFFDDADAGEPLEGKSLWSGTACVAYVPGRLHGKVAARTTKEEFLEEVVHQMFRSEEFRAFIEENNDFSVRDVDVEWAEVWPEWQETAAGELVQANPKWVDAVGTHAHRLPHASDSLSNMYYAGAHTRTSIDIWSMEGAVESGKRVANLIVARFGHGEPAFVHEHTVSGYLAPFRFVDDLLYAIRFPHVVDTLLILALVLVGKKLLDLLVRK